MVPNNSPQLGEIVAPPSASVPSERPRAYRVNDFCRLYGIGRTGVYRLIKEGKLPSVVVAGRRVIPTDAAEALLSGQA
jgi:excisionase family DNA binding protein